MLLGLSNTYNEYRDWIFFSIKVEVGYQQIPQETTDNDGLEQVEGYAGRLIYQVNEIQFPKSRLLVSKNLFYSNMFYPLPLQDIYIHQPDDVC